MVSLTMQDSTNSPMKESWLEDESENSAKFDNSLQELKEFSRQLYHAADYCQASFLENKEKAIVVEHTKEYVYRAIVTVVDHLGTVSANLECSLSKCNAISQAELRIDCLKQRLVTCQQYSNKLALAKLYSNDDVPRYHIRYISPPLPNLAAIDQGSRNSGCSAVDASKGVKEHEFEAELEVPLFLYTYNCKPLLVGKQRMETNAQKKYDTASPPVLPVRDGLSTQAKAQHAYFQFQEARKHKHSIVNWKAMLNKDIASLIRRGKRIRA